MNVERRIRAFDQLGTQMLSELQQNGDTPLNRAIASAGEINQWFIRQNVVRAIDAIATQWLTRQTLHRWISEYPSDSLNGVTPKSIGVVMAGNVPLVGFHDLLCVLMCGYRFIGKFSSKDSCLMEALIDMLVQIEPEFADCITITQNYLTGFDAVIATGSNSTSQHFDYYFRGYPTIIRKHRNSVAIITGKESPSDIMGLGDDIFAYFGLGCRSVSKIFVPRGYNLIPLLDSFEKWNWLINHNRYANNYEYSRALFAMNQVKHLDTGFLLVAESEQIDSAVGVLYYEEYDSISEVEKLIGSSSDAIQCVVGLQSAHPTAIPFGAAQSPAINDYADGIDTLRFLFSLQ